ncbi:MAG: DUF6440 family protein [Ruminococcus sp.]|nr:DUF6440 family protein [Ruminococcus sp.]
MKNKNNRFVKTSSSSIGLSTVVTLVDRETGVEYAVLTSGYSSTMTPLIRSGGTPKTVSVSDFEE